MIRSIRDAVFLLCALGAGLAAQQRNSHIECLIEEARLPAELHEPSGIRPEEKGIRTAASGTRRAEPLRAERHGDVAVIYDDGRLFGRANWRDLENVTLHFERQEGGQGYRFRRSELEWREPAGDPIRYDAGWPRRSVEVDLPFEFPFGGETWRKVSLNNTGSISFGFREDVTGRPRYFKYSEYGPQQLVKERLIAALWTITYDPDDHRLWWQATEQEAVATWRVTEAYARGQAFRAEPGYDEFQIVLRRNGDILLSYRNMTTPAGAVGVFPGQSRFPEPKPMASFAVAPRPNIPAYTEMVRVWAERISPTEMLLGMELKGEPVPQRGRLFYRHFLDTTGPFTAGGMPFGEQETTATVFWQDGKWRFRVWNIDTEGEIRGREVRIVVPLGPLAQGGKIRWFADAVDFDINGAFSQFPAQVLEIEKVEDGSAPRDFSELPEGVYRGSVFEVFHGHPVLTETRAWTQAFYEHFADTADLLVFYMSGRPDWTEGGARSSGSLAGGIRGIGIGNEWRPNTGSAGRLQGFQEVSWIDAYSCEKSGRSRQFGPFDHYSLSMYLNGHELGHRWGILFDPSNRKAFPQISDNVHWLNELHHPAGFCETDPPCSSLMGGSVWEEAQPGFFVPRHRNGYLQKTGYGPLELYIMGLMTAEEVEKLFVLKEARSEFRPGFGWGFAANRDEFGVDSIIQDLGKRWPDPAHSQKEFNTVYVLFVLDGHELREDQIAKVQGIREAWIETFSQATLRRATMISRLEEKPASRLQVVSGNHQWVETGAAAEFPIVFRLADEKGQPLSDRPVALSLKGGGKLEPAEPRTDRNGQVQIRVTAGGEAGTLTVEAKADGVGEAEARIHVAPPAGR
jgi:hypothetical protein